MPSTTRKRGSHPKIRDARPDILIQALDPELVAGLTLGSNKRVEWQCERTHRWHATPCDRLIEGTGCPYCSGRLAIPGETDLATTHRYIAATIRGVDPTTVLAGSHKKYIWECSRGHQWKASAQNRALKGSDCPYCCGRLPIVGETDLATLEPDLAAQIVDADPTTLTRCSNKRVTWRCELGHEWKQSPGVRIQMKCGCPYCANLWVLPGFNDLMARYPQIGAEAWGWDPTQVMPFTTKRLEWECSLCMSHWLATAANRTSHGAKPGCPSCHNSGFKVNAPAFLYILHRSRGSVDELKVGITCNIKTRMTQHRRYGWTLVDASEALLGQTVLSIEQAFLRHLDRQGVQRGRRGAGGEPGFTETWLAADYPVRTVHEIISAVTEVEAA